MKDEYSIYLEKYSKVKSGAKIEEVDFLDVDNQGEPVEFDNRQRLAVSLAVNHAKSARNIMSKNELIKEIDDKVN